MQQIRPSNPDANRRPLAVAVASVFALSAPAALATNLPVASCLDDGGPTTLRSVVTGAGEGDVVDLTALTCPSSKITLAAGGQHIQVSRNDLTIKGPASGLTIDGTALYSGDINYSNVFYHTGTGNLKIKYLTVTGGHESHRAIDALGGCIYSKGKVYLDHSAVTNCTVNSVYYSARGAGIYAKGGVIPYYSLVSGNTATGPGATGGGIHTLAGVLSIESTVTGNKAKASAGASGGGILSQGPVTMVASNVSFNSAESTGSGTVSGGGIDAVGDVKMYSSRLKYNTLTSSGSGTGGGASISGAFLASYSTVNTNSVAPGGTGTAGGVFVSGDTTLDNSTISGNTASDFAGIDAFAFFPAGNVFLMRNSTISGNSAANAIGGVYSNSPTTKFYNSTIAFNTAASGTDSPGVVISGLFGATAVTLQSTLMSNNTYGSNENDLSTRGPGNVTFNTGPANNLVRATFVNGLPADTKFAICPLLGSLRYNGGITQNHALLSTSPAIDNGNNILALLDDQRGKVGTNLTGDYVRVSGPVGDLNPKADIGAHEVQQDDVIFNANFEGCPLLI